MLVYERIIIVWQWNNARWWMESQNRYYGRGRNPNKLISDLIQKCQKSWQIYKVLSFFFFFMAAVVFVECLEGRCLQLLVSPVKWFLGAISPSAVQSEVHLPDFHGDEHCVNRNHQKLGILWLSNDEILHRRSNNNSKEQVNLGKK